MKVPTINWNKIKITSLKHLKACFNDIHLMLFNFRFRVLLHKANVFTVSLKNDKVTFDYFTRSSPTIQNKIEFINVIFEQGEWHHLALVVHDGDITLFIDGQPTRSSVIAGLLNNKLESLRVGQNTQGKIIF